MGRLILISSALVAISMVLPTHSDRGATQQSVAAESHLDVPAGFSGAVLVAQGNRVILSRGYGDERGRAVPANERFWIASVGKQFVAASVMKLVKSNRLALDDTLDRFFPNVPSDKAQITIRQLLSHTSGLGQSYVSERQRDRATAVRAMLAEPTEIAAGSKFRYSNSNTQLLVAVVEVVSGTTYPNYVRRELWAPVRLRDTGFAGTSGAEKVIPVRGKLPPMLQRAYWGGQGVYSSASDLLQWYRALPTEKILGKVHAAAMFAPVVTIGEGTAGLGWFTGKTARGSEYHFVRGNEDVGANALLYSYPAQSIVIIVLTHEGNADENTSWSRKVLHSLENQLML